MTFELYENITFYYTLEFYQDYLTQAPYEVNITSMC